MINFTFSILLLGVSYLSLWIVLGVYMHDKVQNPSSAFALKMEPNGHCYHIVKTVRRQGFYKIWINFEGETICS